MVDSDCLIILSEYKVALVPFDLFLCPFIAVMVNLLDQLSSVLILNQERPSLDTGQDDRNACAPLLYFKISSRGIVGIASCGILKIYSMFAMEPTSGKQLLY